MEAATGWVSLFRWLWSSFDILMLLAIASALKLFRMRMQSAEREKQLVEEKLQSELNFLRAQTNPHKRPTRQHISDKERSACHHIAKPDLTKR